MKRYVVLLSLWIATMHGLEIFPRQVVMSPNGKLQFCVYEKQNGAVNTPQNVRWSVENGSMTSGGLYTAPYADGKYRITASTNNKTVQAVVYVKSRSNNIVQSIQIVVPTTTIYEKQQVQLKAVAYNQAGNEVHFSPIWQASGAGSVSAAGLLSAQTSGNVTIQVRDGNSPISASVNMTIYANKIKRVVVSPKSTSLSLGGKMRFFAIGYDDNGKEVPFKPRWYVEGQGSIKQTGDYTAGSYRGSAKVWAKDPISGRKGHAKLTISSGGQGNQGTIEIGTALIHNSYTLRIAYQVLGINIHRTKLFAIQPGGSKQLLAEQTCHNGTNVVFEKQFPYRTIGFEIQVLDNYNRLVGSIRRTLAQLK